MAGVLIVVAVMAGGAAYVVGRAFVASRDSFLRSMTGGIVLAGCVLFALFVPPTVQLLDGGEPLGTALYRALWLGLSSAGLLTGMRAWRLAGRMRDMRMFTLDESVVSRAESQLALAGSLTEALDVLDREKVTAKDVERLAGKIRDVASRYWFQMPEKDAEVYRLVAGHVAPVIAASVTGLLLEAAARR